MKILVINGDPKTGGFIAGTLDIVATRLEKQGGEVQKIRLVDQKIEDCIGCFHCLKTGQCVLQDDMDGISQAMLQADGFVVGSPVRNGLTTACYKRFYERITYLLGFPLLLEDKYTLGIASVGFMGGKAVCKRLVGLQDICHTRLSDFLFYAVGLPTKIQPADIKDKLEQAADTLLAQINTRPPRGSLERLQHAVDRAVMRKLMFAKSPDVYAHVIENWKKKQYMS